MDVQIDGEGLRAIRILAGWSVARFAQEIGIAPSHVSNIEAGRRQASPEVVKRMADTLGVPTSTLLKPKAIAS